MREKKILIVSFSYIQSDPRVRRQIDFFKNEYSITVLGFGELCLEKINMLSVQNRSGKIVYLMQLLKAFCYNTILKRYFKYYSSLSYVKEAKQILKQLNLESFDLIISNDINSLPIVLNYFDGNKVLFDAHEFSPFEFSDKYLWRLCYQNYNEFLCKEFIPKAKYFTTVCEGLSKLYADFLKCSPPVVITNAPSFSPQYCPKIIDENDSIKLIHHGAAIPSRQIELMVDMMDYLPGNYSLDFMLTNTGSRYYKSLQNRAKNKTNIKFIQPVPYDSIVATLNEKYDMGIFLLPPVNSNYEFALPNKFFEFIQARLSIAIGPSTEMKVLVKKYELGVIANDFTPKELATSILKMNTNQINSCKQNADKVAIILSAEENRKILKRYTGF